MSQERHKGREGTKSMQAGWLWGGGWWAVRSSWQLHLSFLPLLTHSFSLTPLSSSVPVRGDTTLNLKSNSAA